MRVKTSFLCQVCGHQAPRWLGRCPDCGRWNSLKEERLPATGPGRAGNPGVAGSKATPINEIEIVGEDRLQTGIGELDRVLGGGVIPGSVILIGGDPGIGKTTLLLQALPKLAMAGEKVLYVSGEESPRQIKMRAQRLAVEDPALFILAETSLKRSGVPVFIIGHVTKEGAIAGPRLLEHIVDTVLYFEGDRGHAYRILRAVKNRFGSTNEIGVFTMKDAGLEEVGNPSELFLAERPERSTGSVVVSSLEGSRPILVELQALVSSTSYAMPKRMANGVELNRVSLLLAVMEKRLGL
nr:DNA repair protein RadA [Nitrospirota bacterium]